MPPSSARRMSPSRYQPDRITEMKKYTSLILTACFLIFMCSCNTMPMQRISGQTIGLSENTMIYLTDRLNETVLDSSHITNNRFTFNLKLIKHPLQVILHTKDKVESKTFWLDKGDLSIKQNSSNFRDVTILGSETESKYQDLRKITKDLGYKKRLEKNFEFVERNKNSIISAYILSVYSTAWGKDKSQQLFNGLSENIRATKYGSQVRRFLDLTKEPKIGDTYTDLSMPDTLGNDITLSESRSKITLIEFWASWCGPCRKENPELVKTYAKYNSKGFEIYAISLDKDKESWINAIKEDGVKWLHVSDLSEYNSDAILIYGIKGVPDNFLINDEGEIIGRNLRGDDLNLKLSEIINKP